MTITTSQKLLADAAEAIELISVDDALELVTDSSYLFVDVRDKDELETGKIVGSLHAPRGMLEFSFDPASSFHLAEFSLGKCLIFVCGSGGRATFATKLAQDFGLNARCLTGGMKGWRAGNGPVAQSVEQSTKPQQARAMNASNHFARTYDEARIKFLTSAKDAGAVIESLPVKERGPDGQKLFTDVAWVGDRTATRILVLLSGTHGVEGMCGSGVQVGSLLDCANDLPKGVAILYIHAINPFGFSWFRRATVEGIDLNRNFLDFDQTLPENPLYDMLADALVPSEWVGPVRRIADQRIHDCIDEIGLPSFVAQLPLGQYKYGFAPFYGGRNPSGSNVTLQQIVKKYLSEATDVAVLDYHTGLGPYGHGELLCFHSFGSDALGRAQAWWGKSLTSVFGKESVAYPATGSLVEGLENMLPQARVTAAIYEFGTVAPLTVLDALRGDHWLYTYGDSSSPLAQEIRQTMFDAFFGDTDEWRRQVWEQSRMAIEKSIRNLDGTA